MKRIVIAIVAAATLAPAGARAAGCTVVFDPVRDVALAGAPLDDRLGASNAIDLTGVELVATGAAVSARASVRNLLAPPPPGVTGAIYEVTWTADARAITARAERHGTAWTFFWFDDGEAGGATTGLVDRAGSAVVIDVPSEVSPGTLERVRARAVETGSARGVPFRLHEDSAPNAGPGGTFVPGGSCAWSTAGIGDACEVLRAPARAGDGDPAEVIDGSTRIREVRLAAAPRSIVAEIAVNELEPPADGVDAQRWEISWFNPRWGETNERQMAFAERRGERVDFGYTRGGRSLAVATGALDHAADVVRIVIPRDDLRLLDGTRLEDVRAATYDVDGSAATMRDALPASNEPGSWVVGATCDAEAVQACPVVVDVGGDARLLQTGRPAPPSYAMLDLRAAGAAPRGDVVELSARVADLAGEVPPAADVVGWTVSWLDGDRRMYAQAERYPEGDVFRYGSREAEGIEPAGPTFAGFATRGSFDRARNVVTIEVPRAMLPDDGTTLSGFGATAWALSGRNTAAVYLVWDDTGARTYESGIDCSA